VVAIEYFYRYFYLSGELLEFIKTFQKNDIVFHIYKHMLIMKSDLPKLLLDIKEGVIDLGWGHPSARLHPLEKIKRSTVRMLDYDHAESLQYGASQGYGPFLDTLAKFLSHQKGYSNNEVFSNQLFITSGASQAIDFICTLFTVAGDTVLVENPTYFVVEGMLKSHKLNVMGVNCDENGLDLDDLEHKLNLGLNPKFLYTIPTFHNPTGTTMPSQNRERLVSLANKYNFYIVADEVYQFIYFNEPPPTSLLDYDTQGKVISLGSFSKILAPGLRLGWIYSNPQLIKTFTDSPLAFSGGGLNHFSSTIVNELIEMNLLEPHIHELQNEYLHRATVMDDALKQYFDNSIEYIFPKGGYYFWIKFINKLDTSKFLKIAEKFGVSYRPGNFFTHTSDYDNFLRLTYTLYESNDLVEGVKRLGKVFSK